MVFNLLRISVVSIALCLGLHIRAQETPVFGYRIVNVFPHDGNAFTQGLFLLDGHLYESTGQYGESSIRQIELKTGKVLKIQRFPDFVFGEGITHWDGQIIGLTWRNNIGFKWDLNSFERLSQFKYKGEGWGLTQDGHALIMSDGTSSLRFVDPSTMNVIRRIDVTARGSKIPNVNELEWINGTLYANIWQSNYIAQIDP